jgi:uncharacterized membrane protein
MTPLRHVRTNFVRGLLIVLPTIITFWLLSILFGVVSGNVTPVVLRAFSAMGVTWIGDWHARFVVPLIGLVLTTLIIYLIGLLAANLVGQRVLSWVEGGIRKIPFVKSIYGGARQLLDAFGSGGKGTFTRVVLVEYPRAGVWTLGFVTSEERLAMPSPERAETRSAVTVFFPTTPNPTSGWLAVVPERDILEIDLSIEEGVKLIVSGGIVAPEAMSARIRRNVAAGDAETARR